MFLKVMVLIVVKDILGREDLIMQLESFIAQNVILLLPLTNGINDFLKFFTVVFNNGNGYKELLPLFIFLLNRFQHRSIAPAN